MDEILIENSEGTSDAASSVAIAETSQIDESESSDPDFEYDNEEEETDSDDDAECNDFDDDVLLSGNEKGTSKRHNK